MGPTQAIKTCLSKSLTFSGRASRSEFWWFALPVIAGNWLTYFVTDFLIIFPSHVIALLLLFPIISIVPFIAVGMRRLNDLNLNRFFFLTPLAFVTTGILLMMSDMHIEETQLRDRGMLGFLIAGPGFWLTFIPILLVCTLNSRHSPNPNEVPS